MEQYTRTEFPRFEPDGGSGGAVSSFFNRFLNLPSVFSSEAAPALTAAPPPPVSGQEELERAGTADADGVEETGEGRSLHNMLRRISSLMPLGVQPSGGRTRYADTELARYWMPDDISRECVECEAKFSTLRRRHHCRVCGQVFCSRCCSQRIPGELCGCAGGLRVCTHCCRVVLRYLRERDASGDISADLRTLHDALQVKFAEGVGEETVEEFVLAGEVEESTAEEGAGPGEVGDVFLLLVRSLPLQQHRYRLVRYSGVWRGADLLQWVMDNTSHSTRVQAASVCAELVRGGLLVCVTEQLQFMDYALYRPAPASVPTPPSTPPRTTQQQQQHTHEAECSGVHVRGSSSSYCLDLNLGESSARLIRSHSHVSHESGADSRASGEEGSPTHTDSAQQSGVADSTVSGRLARAGEEHLQLLMQQCLAREALCPAWLSILLPLCVQAADMVAPDLHAGEQDVRQYVQVKKVAGGTGEESRVVCGAVLSKNVAHRGMPQRLTRPAVLLLDCSVTYQRREGKRVSLEPLLLQEQEYLSRMGARLLAWRPGVVVVRGAVARGVQDQLRSAGVALATHVRERALRRLARCLHADTLTSIDSRIGTPRLGHCDTFHVDSWDGKTLMMLETSAPPTLGCCILLRGGSARELARVKRAVRFMLLACYNWKLERALHADMGAALPALSQLCDDDAADEEETSVGGEGSAEVSEARPRIRSDCDKTPSCGVLVRDFSDPLHAHTLHTDTQHSTQHNTLTADPDSSGRRWWAEEVVLSMSPHVHIAAPYMETEAGRRCPLRRYFRSPLFRASPPPARRAASPPPPRAPHRPARRQHAFARTALAAGLDRAAVRARLAHYRAAGGTLLPPPHHAPGCGVVARTDEVVAGEEREAAAAAAAQETPEPEPLEPNNHQSLNLLIYSFCSKSANTPDFCVNPWLVRMEMYGRHDISLGAFLDKYCFNSEYRCPSRACAAPMSQHVRRFVHADGCVTVTCNTVGTADADRAAQPAHTTWWSQCSECGASSAPARLSRAALTLSLAKYLELRVLAPRYVASDVCAHSLHHAHLHYFAKGHTAARFGYSRIDTWEVVLPPRALRTPHDTRVERDALLHRAADLLLRGHETWSGVETGGEVEREHAIFRQRVEQLQAALTSQALRALPHHASVVRMLWRAADGLVAAESVLREASERFRTAPALPAAQPPPPPRLSGEEGEETSSPAASDSIETSGRDTDPASEEEEERGDRKTVRAILSQLLSTSQPATQGGIIMSGGVVGVEVWAGEVGSVVAAGLASVQYRQQLQLLQQTAGGSGCGAGGELEESGGEADTRAGGKAQQGGAARSEHIEVLLKEGLLCRVYYAAQFQQLRALLIAPLAADTPATAAHDSTATASPDPEASSALGTESGLSEVEEGYIRSLAHCVAWSARGGKSGSTFCKTKDDRYVLKEMSKQEWQQFLEFAPHYFNYVTRCHNSELPSLLVRIVGVYSVGGAGNGVLVMENLFHGHAHTLTHRFDLKGACRNRLAADTGGSEAVLLDENLLQMRWESPLYVGAHAAQVLQAAVERDSAFLAKHHVMDYSLLLGVDSERRQLVLGVIDYIRTFTWDKKLEHLVKKNLGSGQPTIVSPAQYRERFCAAARKYFLHAPSRWDCLHRGLRT